MFVFNFSLVGYFRSCGLCTDRANFVYIALYFELFSVDVYYKDHLLLIQCYYRRKPELN